MTSSLDRRSFMAGSATLFGSAGLTALSGCAAGLATAGATTDSDGFAGGPAARLQTHESLIEGARLPTIESYRVQDIPAIRVVKNGVAGLLWTHSYSQLAETDPGREQLAAPLRARAAGISRSLFTTTNYLAGLSEEDLLLARETLRERPAVARQLHDDIVHQGLDKNMGTRSLRQFTEIFDHVTWRISRQPASLLVDGLVERVERLAAAQGADRRALVLDPAIERGNTVGLQVYNRESQADDKSCERAPEIDAGLVMLGAGGAVLAGSTIALALLGSWPISFGITLGAIVFVAGIVFIAVGAERDRQG